MNTLEIKIPAQLRAKLEAKPELGGVTLTAVSRFGKLFASSGTPFFRNYPDHGAKHVSEVLETSFRLISGPAWELVTPQDSVILILAVLLHDAALHLQEDGFLQLLGSQGARFRIPELDTLTWFDRWDEFRAKISRLDRRKLREIFGTDEPIEPPALRRPEKWTQLQFDYIGEFLRTHHARLAHEIARFGIPGPSDEPLGLAGLDATFADLAGFVARSHGMPLRQCLSYLETRYHLRDFQGAHLVFLMAILRVADYLQIQAERAPKEVLKVKSLRSPIARREWNVHHAIAAIAYSNPDPEAIRIQVDARKTELKTFLRLREWQTGLQQELDNSWAVLGEIYGRYSASKLNQLGLTIRRVTSDLDDVQIFANQVPYVPERIAFSTADAGLLQLLIGPLYGGHPEVGIRELIQNAVDAVLELEDYCKHHGIQRGSLPFADQVADVTVEYIKGPPALRVTDKGMGMTAWTVRDYFLAAGASFRNSDYWKSEFQNEAGESRINRSGRFGVGLLAAFLLGSVLRVTTRHVSEPWGVTFVADLDTEAIELRRIECPVGTSIEVRLSPLATKSLTFDNVDWFFLAKPRLLQLWHDVTTIEEISPRWTVPSCKENLPSEWRRLKAPGFADIQWTYTELPELICNGIEVRDLETAADPFAALNQKSFLAWRAELFRYPSLSVFDPNGNLPMTLTRDRLAVDTLPFDDVLAREVTLDFIAYCLVTAPNRSLFTPGCKATTPFLKYPGFRSPPMGTKAPPYWVQTANGSVLADAALLALQPTKSLFLPEFGSSYVPQWVNVAKHVSKISLQHGHSSNTYDIRTVLYHWERSRPVDGFTPIHFAGARYLVDRNFADSWNQRGVLRASTRKQITETWKNRHWIVWQLGDCEDPQVDLQAIAAKISRTRRHSIVCAEKFIDSRVPQERKDSSILNAWKEVVGSGGIPYDEVDREKIVARGGRNIRDYVARWKRQREWREPGVPPRDRTLYGP